MCDALKLEDVVDLGHHVARFRGFWCPQTAYESE